MYVFRNYLFAAVTFMIVVMVFALISPRTTYGQGRPPAPVEVVNTPAVDAQQSGPWSVGLEPGATVNVGNTETNPVPVLNVNAATQLFQKRLSFEIVAGDTQNQISIDVPEGKRLVIEHISARVQGPTGQKFIAHISTTAFLNGAAVGTHWLVLMFQGTFSGIDLFTAAQPMRAYADPSVPTANFVVTRTTSTGTAFAEATISGYLVDQ